MRHRGNTTLIHIIGISQPFEIVELRYSSSLYRHVKSGTRKLRLKFHQLPNMNNP